MSKEQDLINAVNIGDVKKVISILKKKSDSVYANTVTSVGQSVLCIAVQKGHKEIVELLLRAGANVDLGDKEGRTPLFISAQEGRKEIVELLLRAGANIYIANKEGQTPYAIAVTKAHKEIVGILHEIEMLGGVFRNSLCKAIFDGDAARLEELLRTKELTAPISTIDKASSRFLCTAINGIREGSHSVILGILLRAGAKVDLGNEAGETPLYIAAQKGYKLSVETLLQVGAKIDLANEFGVTPLHVAVENGHKVIVEILLRAKANVNLFEQVFGYTPLHVAVCEGHTEIIELFLRAGVKVDVVSEFRETPLYLAAQNGHKEVVEFLLKFGAKVDLANAFGETPLCIAAEGGYKEIVELLLKAKADIDIFEQILGYSPLHIAVYKGHMGIADVLLRAGVKVDLYDKVAGLTPLHIAAQEGHKELVAMLLGLGAKVDLPTYHDEATPLYMAAKEGHKKVVEILLKAGAKIDLPDNVGCTPLCVAVREGHKKVVEFLLRAGSKVDVADRIGDTPLHIAVTEGRREREMVELLLGAGANVGLSNIAGQTPLYMAVSGSRQEIIEILLRAGAKVEVETTCKETPLYRAALLGRKRIVELLLEAGAKVDVMNLDRQTPLYAAAYRGSKEVVEVLLRAGAKIDLTEQGGSISLHVAAREGHKEVVGILLKAGAKIDAVNRLGITPLYAAARKGHKEVVEILLRAGAEVNLRNTSGRTALHIAAWGGYKEIIEVLLKAGAELNLDNKFGETPLYVAAKKKHKALVEFLLKAGAKDCVTRGVGDPAVLFIKQIAKVFQEEREAKERAEAELRRKEQEIREREEREARERKEREEKAAREREQAELRRKEQEARERQEREAREKQDREAKAARERAEAELRRKEQEARERQEREAREKQDREAKAARERAEAELRRKEQEARERQEREAWERQEREAKAKDSRVQKLDEASLIKVISYLASKQSYLEVLKSKLQDLVAKERGPLVQLCSKMQGLLDEIIKELKSLSGLDFQLLPLEDQTTLLDLINHLVFINPDIIDVAWLTKELAFLASKHEYLVTLKRRIEVATKHRAEKISILEEKLHNFELEAKAAELASDYKAVIKSYVFIQDCYNQIVALGIDRSQQLAAIAQKIKETQSKLSQTATPSPSPVQERHEVVGPGQVKCRIIPYVDLQLDQELGSGGFGTVYRGLWRTENIAAKKLHTTQLTASSRQAFIAEVEIMSKLDSERLVRLYGVCVAPDPYCIVMEYMPRGSLYSLLHGTEQYSWQISLQIAIDIGNGLAFLHREKVIHRDLKSLNVLLDAQYRAKICDFGLSKVRQEVSVTSTRPVTAVGTNAWNAPELFGLRPKYTYASDIYAYGIILWEILTREIPYKDVLDPNQIQIAVKVGEREEIPASCSPVYRESIERCWGQVPEKRPEASHVVQVLKGELATIAVKSWHVAPELKPAGRNAEGYYIVDAGDYDVRKVVECYQRCPVPGMEVGRVKIIFNPVLNKSFADGIELLEGRFGNPAFAAKWSSDGDARITAWRSEVIRRFEAMAQPYQDATFPHVKILPVWHGTRAAIIGSIAKTGYANLATTDAGFFGKGLYSSYEAEYAYRVYGPGSQGANGILVVNWIACFSAYPVVGYRVPGYGGVVPEPGDMERLKEKGNFGNYDAHFVPVRPATSDPNEVNYYPCRPSERATYHEVVVFEKTQILPRYIVELQPVMVAPLLATAGMFAGKQPKQEAATKTHAPAP